MKEMYEAHHSIFLRAARVRNNRYYDFSARIKTDVCTSYFY